MSLPPRIDPVEHCASLAARRLREAISALEAGREQQPGKFIALENAIRLSPSGLLGWTYFMLNDAKQDLLNGRSLALHHALPLDQKLNLYDRTLDCFNPIFDEVARDSGLATIRDYLLTCFPYWTRCHVHGTRRRIPDPDLLLIDALVGTGCYTCVPMPMTAYCIEYKRYRLMLTPNSIPRLERLLEKLQTEFAPEYTGPAGVTR